LADEIPLVLRQAAQLTDRPARQDPAEVMAKPVKRTAVGVVERTDRVVMQRADVIRFEKRIERAAGLMRMPAAPGPRRRPIPFGLGAGCSISVPTNLSAGMAKNSA